ncbi:hypothetical protein COZ39_02330 [Candidatus Roizmanbacteria bacterium CG_4_10_14_3_um_filter_33_21]|uniref:Uncharacterized protein n=2 Tax=Candidatus Roizmaniibacteriota TaxID=1752723 RepID=A0A2M7LYK9_9BACT|nr:MAG: hypothetical protein COZ39_02330 [Candidatus Roizmanbacteria bacterium CG_4_10_14_3_um_filter_33_21]
MKINWQKINLLKILRLEKLTSKFIYGLVFAVLIILNLLIAQVPLRLDLSEGKAYTLSTSTKKIISKIDDIVNIKFFNSSTLPPRLLPLKTEVTDLLSEYGKDSRGKIVVRIVDPKKDEKTQTEVQELGIPELPFQQMEKDKYAVSSVYFGILITYGDKKEVIPQATDIGSLEYSITSAIYKISRKEQEKIGVIGYDTAADPQTNPLASLDKVLGQQFLIEPVTISSDSASSSEIAKDIKTLLVFDTGSKKYTDLEINTIKNYIKNNGKVLVFVDGVWVNDSLTTAPAEHNLFSLMDYYGINLQKNLLLSTTAELVNFGNETMQFFSPYPFWVKANMFNNKTGYFTNIRQLTFPWSASVQASKKSGWEINELIKTSNKSWEQKDNFVLNPQSIPEPQANDLKEYLVGMEAKSKSNGQLVVIPSSRFVLDRYLSQSSDNLELVLNIVNGLAAGGALSGIRSRAVGFYPLPELSDSSKDVFKYGNILLLPVLFGIYGAFRVMRRK